MARRGRGSPTGEGGGAQWSVSAIRLLIQPVASSPLPCRPSASGDQFFPEAENLGVTRHPPNLLSLRTFSNGWFSPVINYSSLWPDLVSNNSPNFEMYVGGLFCFSLLFLLTFRQMEVLFSVQKPQHFIFLSFRFFFFLSSATFSPSPKPYTQTNSLYPQFIPKRLSRLFCPGESGFILPGGPSPPGSGFRSALSQGGADPSPRSPERGPFSNWSPHQHPQCLATCKWFGAICQFSRHSCLDGNV